MLSNSSSSVIPNVAWAAYLELWELSTLCIKPKLCHFFLKWTKCSCSNSLPKKENAINKILLRKICKVPVFPTIHCSISNIWYAIKQKHWVCKLELVRYKLLEVKLGPQLESLQCRTEDLLVAGTLTQRYQKHHLLIVDSYKLHDKAHQSIFS